MLGISVIYLSVDFMNVFRHPESLSSHFIWPLIFLASTAIAHPFLLVALRVQASMQHKHGKKHLNSFQAMGELGR